MTRRRRRFIQALIVCGFSLVSLGATPVPGTSPVLVPMVAPEESLTPPATLSYDDALWSTPSERARLIQAIDYSLQYLATPQAEAAYAQYPVQGFTRDRIQRSLRRLKHLLLISRTSGAFQQALLREFALYQSIGHDGQGTVDFTGYFEPIYAASRTPSAEYRYPLYRRPPDLDTWSTPHPTRLELEGADGLQSSQGRLAGLELVWLKDRLEAFLVQVQGSAKLKLPDGTLMSVGYAGRTEYPYKSIGRALVEEGILPAEGLTLPQVIAYFRQHPEALNTYLPRNERFIFFKETAGGAPTGSLRVPVTAGRSIATDKTLMPPGAPALIAVALPERNANGTWSSRPVNRFVLDQDTGGAITGPGRVDLFVGTGPEAGERAGLINTTGSLYYLLLRE
ncbi:MAG TPA: murein transglycosylase A [Leptolyngbyaceae cyanobacterium]